MDRRRLIGMLGLAPLFAAVAARLAPAIEGYPIVKGTEKQLWKRGNDSFEYKGYTVWWTGWKYDQGTVEVVAQWAAFWIKDGKHALYVSNPGGWGPMEKGTCLRIHRSCHQVFTIKATPLPILDMVKAEMRLAMMTLIDYADEHQLQEVDAANWTGMPWVHPEELPEYDGWKRLTPEQIADIQNEERLGRQQKVSELSSKERWDAYREQKRKEFPLS